MLRRLVLAPLLVALAVATATPATADGEDYWVLCIDSTVVLENIDLPPSIGRLPDICVPIPVPLP